MMSSSRRTVLKGSLTIGAAVAMPAALRAATATTPGLFVYDARFAASSDLAAYWEAQGVPVLDPREHDLGLAWRGRIPELLASRPRIEGATLWSDRFICETFAAERGLKAQGADRAIDGAAGGALHKWSLA